MITQQIMNGNIILTFPLKLYPLESYGRELQHMLKSTLLDNKITRYWTLKIFKYKNII